MPDLKNLLDKPEFPRASQYDAEWVLENQMGPNALWLLEWLLQALRLEPGMRVLDLGCGRAISSIFLAKEQDVQVWAADLWVTPEHNRRRVEEAGVAHAVFPLRAEAHALQFAENFFDAIISIDAYHYFGTDVLYLGYLSRFLRPGGQLGIVVPGLMQTIDEVPEHLETPQSSGKVFWEDECWSFKTADWWREHLSRNSTMADLQVDSLKDGWRHWRDFERVVEQTESSVFLSDAEALEKDAGSYLGFVRAVAQRTGPAGINFYDPAIASDARVSGVMLPRSVNS